MNFYYCDQKAKQLFRATATVFFVTCFGLIGRAATETPGGTATKHIKVKSTSTSSLARKDTHLQFYINESLNSLSFAGNEPGSSGPIQNWTVQSVYDIQKTKLARQQKTVQIPLIAKQSASIRKNIDMIKKSVWSLRSDCIKPNTQLLITEKSQIPLNEELTSSYSALQDDCLNAQSLHIHNKDRPNIESFAHDSYLNFKNNIADGDRISASDFLEKAYLSFLYLAITENSADFKDEYFFIAGYLGLKLWSFNKDDAAILPLLALAADDHSSPMTFTAWLLIKDHLQFSYSGSAGEHIPQYWNTVLLSIKK